MMNFKKLLPLSSCLLTFAVESNAMDDFSISYSTLGCQSSLRKSVSLHNISEHLEEISIEEKEKSPLPSSHPWTIDTIQKDLLRQGKTIDELEGGFVLIFNSSSGKLTNPEICHLSKVGRAMKLGSPDAYLVMGLILQHHQVYHRAFDQFLIAASGNNGVSEALCGGTSSEVAFYNMHKLLSAGGFKDENGHTVYSEGFDKYSASQYKKFSTFPHILNAQLESLEQTVKGQSRKQAVPTLQISSPKHSFINLLSPRKNQSHSSHTPSAEHQEEKDKKHPSSPRVSLKALLSPRLNHK